MNQDNIGANVFGNMWAQDWNSLYDLVAPFPDKVSPDPGPGMEAQDWSVDDLIHTSD